MKQILDHGYIKLVEGWGSDERIIEAARMSTDKGFLGWGTYTCPVCLNVTDEREDAVGHGSLEYCAQCSRTAPYDYKIGDEKLLEYLYTHKHDTPFEFAGLVVEVQAPIFVFREWHRHRTQSYNEMSARYTPLPDVNYAPTLDRLMLNAGGTNKQAGTIAAADALSHENALQWLERLDRTYADLEDFYRWGLQIGVPKELARVALPVGRYSRMRASMNLRNALAFLTLRSSTYAQWEIRQFADALGEIIAELFPRTWALYLKGQSVKVHGA